MTAVVTGASRGIGRACAFKLGRAGMRVVVNYNLSKDKAERVCAEIKSAGGFAVPFKADVSDRKAVKEMFDFVSDSFGGADVLVNNAGIARQAMFSDVTEAEWDRFFNVNVKGVYNCTQEALPHMIHCKYGRIINMSSMWGISGASCEVPYSASKAAVIGMTRALAKELGPSGITVNAIAPGVIDTEMNGQLSAEDMDILKESTPLERIGSPEDVANAVEFLASERASFITGQVLSVDGGFIL